MSLGLYDYDHRRRRRTWFKTLKTLLTLAFLLGLGLFAYQMGVEGVKHQESGLKEENSRLQEENGRLRSTAAQAEEGRIKAETRSTQLEERLRKEVPAGELGRLSQLVSQRLSAGILPERLAFVINATQNPRNCKPAEDKRFVMPIPGFRGPHTSVSFADSIITVTGEGQAAKSKSGSPERWFDPQQPVTVRFSQTDGSETTATGMLPLHQSIVIGATEYRFTIDAGSRSFVQVTADRCPFP